jgi:dipeptidyl aminopeptidase/acylaminoacyl peptidase
MSIRRHFRTTVLTASICLASLAGPPAATNLVQAKQKIELADLFRQEAVSEFTFRPEALEAVYVRSRFDGTTLGRRTSLWRARVERTDDGEKVVHEPLEAGEPDGRNPVFSPDGNWLVFVSNRNHPDGSPAFAPVPPYSDPAGDVWLMPMDGSRPPRPLVGKDKPYGRVFTDGFYGRIAFSSDGKRLVFVADDARQARTDAEAKAGIEILSQGEDDLSLASHLADDQGEGYEGYGPAQIWVADLALHFVTAEHVPIIRRLTMDHFWYGDPQWTPDGQAIICHANRTDDQESVRFSINKNYDLWRIPSGGRDPKYATTYYDDTPERLTLNTGPDVSPRISPDGGRVAYLSVPRRGPHADVYDVRLMTLGDEREERIVYAAHRPKPLRSEQPAGHSTQSYPQFPLPADAWRTPKTAYFRGVHGMHADEETIELEPVTAAEERAVRERESTKSAARVRLTPKSNAWLDDRYRAREQIVEWKSFDGRTIDGVLTLPPTELTEFPPADRPLIVFPHGGPHSASRTGFNFTVEYFAAQGYAVFQPNFRGTAGYGRDFLDAARFDMGGSDMQDILTGIEWLIERKFVDPKRQFVYGISYGGYTASRLVTLTKQFDAVSAVNAVTDLHAMWSLSDLQSWSEWEFGGKPWETVEHEGRQIDVGALMRDRSPTTHAHKVKTPTLILHSDHDRRCPVAMGRMFYRALQESGCKTELVVYDDERHGMWQLRHQADVLERTVAWFKKHETP